MINQAVLFTKPVHPLGIDLSPEELDLLARDYFGARGFSFIVSKWVSGAELAQRETIRRHYEMYSRASYGEIAITPAGKNQFKQLFGRSWDSELQAERIMGNPQLLQRMGISADELFLLWSAAAVKKVQPGLLMAWLEELGCYCINAFYPAMEANFYHPEMRMAYHVVEFDSLKISWKCFRAEILGITNASKADPESFRGMLYERYRVEFPGRDNFVHGSAGPLEGLVERAIHEDEFSFSSNPIGRYLEMRGVNFEQFSAWKSQQGLGELAQLYSLTEDVDSDDAVSMLSSTGLF